MKKPKKPFQKTKKQRCVVHKNFFFLLSGIPTRNVPYFLSETFIPSQLWSTGLCVARKHRRVPFDLSAINFLPTLTV